MRWNKEDVCNFPYTIQDENSMCIKKVYEKRSIEEIKKACNFECRGGMHTEEMKENALPIINTVAYREYVLTRPNGDISFKFGNGTRKEMKLEENGIGAYHLRLGCQTKLMRTMEGKEITLIDSEIPCFQNEDIPEEGRIARIIPSAWVKLPDTIIED
jgi:hypothetical protein